MSDFVRVRVENGMEVSVSSAFYGRIEGDVEKLDEPATNTWGRPLSATRKNGRRRKPRTSVQEAAAKKATVKSTAGGQAATSPEEGTE